MGGSVGDGGVPGALELRWDGDETDGTQAVLASARFRAVRRGNAAVAATTLAIGAVLLVTGPRAFGGGALLAGGLILARTAAQARRTGRVLPLVAGPVTAVAVPGEGLTITGPGSAQHHRWGVFGAVEETDRAFVLQAAVPAMLPTVLPKRGVPDGRLDALRALLADEVGRAGPAAGLGPLPQGAFELAWTPTEADWVEVSRARRWTPKTRRQLRRIGLAFALVLILTLLNREFMLAGLVAAGIAPMLYLLGPGQARTARRVWRATPALHTPQLARVLPEGLTLVAGASTVHWRWDEFGGLLSTAGTFVLHGNSNHFAVLAKRGLADTGRLPELEARLREAVPA